MRLSRNPLFSSVIFLLSSNFIYIGATSITTPTTNVENPEEKEQEAIRIKGRVSYCIYQIKNLIFNILHSIVVSSKHILIYNIS